MINPDKLTEEQINNTKNSLSDFSKKINEFVNQIVIDIPKIQIPSFSNFSEQIIQNIKIPLDDFSKKIFELLHEEMLNASNLGWCFAGLANIGVGDFLEVYYFTNFQTDLSHKTITIQEIDNTVIKYFNNETIQKISATVIQYISKKEFSKYEQSVKNFKEERFYECASILIGLIDSFAIKYVLENNPNEPYISQGWMSFAKAYLHKYENILNTDYIAPRDKEKITKLSNDELRDVNIKHFLTEDFLLCCTLTKLYEDSDWKNYPTSKPDIINRNWLAHGMYDYDDITKADCFKLFFIYCLMLIVFYKDNKSFDNNSD